MSKKQKLSFSQSQDLQGASMEDVQQMAMERLSQSAAPTAAAVKSSSNIATTQAVASSEPQDIEAIMAKYTDPITGSARPVWADGSSPTSAINESPVSLADRAKLSVGNERGTISYLKSKFPDVKKTKSGMFAVLNNDGLWYNVDPENLGDGSPIQKMKEAIADYGVDILPELIGVGASIGTAMATGGTSIPAQIGAVAAAGGTGAALGSAKIVMGKLLGTYQATPEEVARDIALETLINAGGQVVGAAAGFAIPKVGEALAKAGRGLSKLNPASKEAIAKVSSFFTKVPEEDVLLWANKPEAVGRVLKQYGSVAKNSDDLLALVNNDNLRMMPKLADDVAQGMQKMYGDGLENIASNVGDNFNPKIHNAIFKSFEDLAGDSGVFKKVGGSFKLRGDNTFKRSGFDFELHNFNKFNKILSNNGETVLNQESYNFLKSYLSNLLSSRGGFPTASGVQGAKNLVRFEKMSSDLLHRAYSVSKADPNIQPALKHIIDMHNRIERNIATGMAESSGYKLYSDALGKLKSSYSSIKNEASELLAARSNYLSGGKNIQDYASIYDKLFKSTITTTKAGQARIGLPKAIAELGDNSKIASELLDTMHLNRAASNAVHTFRPGLAGTLAPGIMVGSGFNPAAVATTAAMSPRLNYEAIKRIGPLLQGSKFVKSLPPDQKTAFFNNPEALQKYFGAILQAPEVHEATKNKLMEFGKMGGTNGQ